MTWCMWEGSNKLLRTSESKSNTQLRMRNHEMQSPIIVLSQNPKRRSNFEDLCVSGNHIKIALKGMRRNYTDLAECWGPMEGCCKQADEI